MKNRELKFRVWYPLLKRFALDTEDGYVYQSDDFRNGGFKIGCDNDQIIQQFTGIKDKNGKDIYEGDILKTQGQLIGSYFREGNEELPAYRNNNIYTWLSKVVWDNGYASFLLEYINQPDYKGRGKFRDSMTCTAPWAEIVGNIFENADLLEPEILMKNEK